MALIRIQDLLATKFLDFFANFLQGPKWKFAKKAYKSIWAAHFFFFLSKNKFLSQIFIKSLHSTDKMAENLDLEPIWNRVAYSGLERRYPGLIQVGFQEGEGFHLFQMLDFISTTRLMIG